MPLINHRRGGLKRAWWGERTPGGRVYMSPKTMVDVRNIARTHTLAGVENWDYPERPPNPSWKMLKICLEEIDRLQGGWAWISVDDMLPADGVYVLTSDPDDGIGVPAVSVHGPDGWAYADADGVPTPSHWMVLPALAELDDDPNDDDVEATG